MSAITRLVGSRRTVALMVRQDIKLTYGQYRLGLIWTVADPLFQAVLMWVVLAFIFGSRGVPQQPYIVYLVTGLLPLAWLSKSVNGGPRVLNKYQDELTYSPLPEVTWPLRLVLVGLADFVLALPVIVLLAVTFFLFTGQPSLTWGVLLFPVGMFLQVLLALGLAMTGAALAVGVPDIQRLTNLLNRCFFWLSPVLWSQRDFPDWLQNLLYLNPFHAILDCYRAAFWPGVLSSWTSYATSLAVIAALLAAGTALFRVRIEEARRLS